MFNRHVVLYIGWHRFQDISVIENSIARCWAAGRAEGRVLGLTENIKQNKTMLNEDVSKDILYLTILKFPFIILTFFKVV